MLETHPFGDFVPENTKYLIVGSFTTKEAYDDEKKAEYVWYYSNGGRNHFWPMLSQIYGVELKTRNQMEQLLSSLGIALVDMILTCERKKKSNLDIQLTNITYNIEGITKIVSTQPLKAVYFTSRFVEDRFRKVFKELIGVYPTQLITLPSPSPRYVLMTNDQKLARYHQLLPKL